MKMTSNSSSVDANDPFAYYSELASHPSSPVAPQLVSSLSSEGDKATPQSKLLTSQANKGHRKSPRPFAFLNGLHLTSTSRQLSSQSSTSSTNEPSESSEAEASGTSSSDEGKKLMRRSSVIMSSGRDRYTYDSETVELPYRSIDVYEKAISHQHSRRSGVNVHHHGYHNREETPVTPTPPTPTAASFAVIPFTQPPPPPKTPSPSPSPSLRPLSPTSASSRISFTSKRSTSLLSSHSSSERTSSFKSDTLSEEGSTSGGICNHQFRQPQGTCSSRSHAPTLSPPSSSPLQSPQYRLGAASPIGGASSRRAFSSSPSTSTEGGSPAGHGGHTGHTGQGVKGRFNRGSLVRSARIELSKAILSNGRFANPWDTWTPLRFANILKFGFTKDKSNIPSKEQLDIVLPIVKPNFDAKIPEESIAVTWLGHSTVLVQMDSVTFITDPIFSERASPSQMVGPKRYRDAPCTIHDLPSNLDAILISHNHYDHLDMNSVTLLNARYGVDVRWFVPLGLSSWFESAGCENVVELDWWEENCIPEKLDISFIFVPSQHWSKRTLADDNKSLWGGWVVIGPRHRFYFAGDTGYCPGFKEIGNMYGPFTASAIPIGAFEPRWFMKYQHVNPEEAVAIHLDVRSEFSLAIHWGTFALANEYYLDPPVKLREALDARNLPVDSFVTFKHGETRIVSNHGSSSPVKLVRRKHVNKK